MCSALRVLSLRGCFQINDAAVTDSDDSSHFTLVVNCLLDVSDYDDCQVLTYACTRRVENVVFVFTVIGMPIDRSGNIALLDVSQCVTLSADAVVVLANSLPGENRVDMASFFFVSYF